MDCTRRVVASVSATLGACGFVRAKERGGGGEREKERGAEK